jgi:glycosyltransferase involved in cell wall biosynthesis
MKITLVTLSYNQKTFLERAIRSIIDQGYDNLEYIIVDPGSEDGSRDVIEKYRTFFAKTILEPDRGPSDGLNKGFESASGEIYGFLNADDLLLPNTLRRVNQYFEQHPECDVLMGEGAIVDSEENVLRRVRVTDFTVDRYFYAGTSWLQQATFFRARAFKAVGGFNTNNRSSWDGELFVKMRAQGACFQCLHENLASFRMHKESITSHVQKRSNNPMIAAYEADFRRIFSELKGRPWSLRDGLTRASCRVLRKVVNPGEIVEAVLYRVRNR